MRLLAFLAALSFVAAPASAQDTPDSGDAEWDVGVPEVSTRDSVTEARAAQLVIRAKQRVGV